MLPSEFANKIGTDYSLTVSNEHKKALGQFFTPTNIAEFMSQSIDSQSQKIKILDPGFGMGVLTCSLIEHLVTNENVKTFEVVGYESDLNIINYSRDVLEYLKKWLYERKIVLSYDLLVEDFILTNGFRYASLENNFDNEEKGKFDIVIANPPYFKIAGDDLRAKMAKDIVNGHPNMYSIFMYYAVSLLKEMGQFVFIVPRSFASGYYFKTFRDRFFRIAKLERIHLFESRRNMFGKENVLQENIIIKGIKQHNYDITETIVISHSNDNSDLAQANVLSCNIEEILNKNTQQKILHVPVDENELRVLRIFNAWKGSLGRYNLKISTGPVVSFRCKEYLKNVNGNGRNNLAPLYDLFNVKVMNLQHPLIKDDKPQYIEQSERTASLLVKNKDYIFLRRFSTKDDSRRLIATPYFMGFSDNDYIGIENHLNYIYRPNGNMTRNEVLGVAALLNSTIFDTYFRIINGNINVSATELRSIPFPPLEKLNEIGERLVLENDFLNSNIDHIVNEILEIEEMIESN